MAHVWNQIGRKRVVRQPLDPQVVAAVMIVFVAHAIGNIIGTCRYNPRYARLG